MTKDDKIDSEHSQQPGTQEPEAQGWETPQRDDLAANQPPAELTEVIEEPESGRVGCAHADNETPAVDTEPKSAEELDTDEESDDEPSEEIDEIEATLETVVESVLFASDEPISASRLVEIAEAGSVKRIRECVKTLNKKYHAGGFSFRIEKISGGYQMMTLPAFNPWISKLIKVRADNKLTPAGLETLAIVAYKQPIIRADIEAIRGVASGEVLRNLMYKGLVKIVGRAEILGRPMLYGTTKKFLDVFGLNTLKDLPKVDELKAPES
jgi:segregation and condensation protein B